MENIECLCCRQAIHSPFVTVQSSSINRDFSGRGDDSLSHPLRGSLLEVPSMLGFLKASLLEVCAAMPLGRGGPRSGSEGGVTPTNPNLSGELNSYLHSP